MKILIGSPDTRFLALSERRAGPNSNYGASAGLEKTGNQEIRVLFAQTSLSQGSYAREPERGRQPFKQRRTRLLMQHRLG